MVPTYTITLLPTKASSGRDVTGWATPVADLSVASKRLRKPLAPTVSLTSKRQTPLKVVTTIDTQHGVVVIAIVDPATDMTKAGRSWCHRLTW